MEFSKYNKLMDLADPMQKSSNLVELNMIHYNKYIYYRLQYLQIR